MGKKPGDHMALPLCGVCHKKQHAHGERSFWALRIGDAKTLAERLYIRTGVDENAIRSIQAFREEK